MKRILIVDDDAKGVAALAIRLRAAGYSVLTASDGLEGLKVAIQHPPDLILMDVWMPNSIGILAAQRLKNVGLGNVPVIFLSASRKTELWAIAEEVQPVGFLEKPYESRELLELIARQFTPTPPMTRTATTLPQPSATLQR